ncbi:hypothetical protein ACWGIU_32515 [Streptomyces sp. NPDC054840]
MCSIVRGSPGGRASAVRHTPARKPAPPALPAGWFVVKRREGPPNWWKHLVMPVLGAAVTVAVISEASWTAQLVGAVWLAVGLAVLLVQRGRRDLPGDTGAGA